MRYLILFTLIVFFVNLIYLGIIYGLYKPGLKRFKELNCVKFNDTHSLVTVGCKKLIFNKSLEGQCFLDKQTNKIEPFEIDWTNLVIVFGSISGLSFLFLIGYLLIFFYNKRMLNSKKLK